MISKALRLFLTIGFLLSSITSRDTVASSTSPITTSSYEVVLQELQKRGFNGSVLMSKDRQEALARSMGVIDANTEELLDIDSRFPIGSVTKTLVATIILQLVDEGALTLDEDISAFFPDISWSKEVTAKQLLAHTAGISNYTNASDFWAWVENNPKAEANDLVDLFKNTELEFKPGSKHAYSNSGYVLLGLMIEKMTGLSFQEALEQRIFSPLEMTGSAYEPDFDGSTATMPHLRDGATLERTRVYSMRWAYAAGGVVSTVRDLAKFNQAMDEGRLLSEKSQAIMETAVHDSYGLGVATQNFEGEKLVWHTGGLPHYIAYNLRIPSRKVSIVVLTNTFDIDLRNLLAHALLEIEVKGETTLPAYRPYLEIPPSITDAYIGKYHSSQIGMSAEIFYDDRGRFRLRVESQEDLGLYPFNELEFDVGLVSALVKFEKDATAFTLFQGGGEFVFERID